MTSTSRRAGLAVVVIATAILAPAAPAAAHPFGPPSSAVVTYDDAAVRVRVLVAEDDWVILGDHLGVFADADGAALSADARLPVTGAELLAASQAVSDHLTDNVEVTAVAPPGAGEGTRRGCDVEAPALTPELLTTGVELAFACPRDATDHELTVTLMNEVHPAYRTAVRLGAAAPHALLTASEPTLRLDAPERVAGSGGVVAAGAAVTAVAAGTLGLRRRGGARIGVAA